MTSVQRLRLRPGSSLHEVFHRPAEVFSKWFTSRIPTRRYTGNHFVKGGTPVAARLDLSDTDFVRDAIRYGIAIRQMDKH